MVTEWPENMETFCDAATREELVREERKREREAMEEREASARDKKKEDDNC